MIRSNTSRANPADPSPKTPENIVPLSEGGGSLRAEDLLGVLLGDAVGEGEAQALLGELADVGSLDVLSLLELDNSENLVISVSVVSQPIFLGHRRTWIDLKRARWRAAMSE